MAHHLAMMARTAHARMRSLPVATLDAFAPGTALVLAPHADDESLGCGGLIAMASARGRPPIIVGVTDGTGSHPSSPTYPAARLRHVREAELRAAAAVLGVASERVHFLGLPDTRAPLEGPEFENAAHRVATLVRVHAIETVFATWSHDPHCDHEATARLGEAVAATTGARLLFYPVWSWLLPAGQVLPLATIVGMRLDIRSVLTRKGAAIACHASQHSDLINDDLRGFRLPAELLAVCEQDFETFIDP
jgi:LmbE family N-acetylglucosaminyl deacetylase